MWLRKLGRRSQHRLAMLKNQVTSLIKHGAITTTFAKAKELRRVADWMVTWAKKGYTVPGTKCDGAALRYRRLANPWIKDKDAFHDLFQELPIRFATRRGGYTRVLKLGTRLGDAAPIARIEWVEWDRPEDKATFEAKRRERAVQQLKVRKESVAALKQNWHSQGLESLRSVGKALHFAEAKTDIKALSNLYRRIQSDFDAATAKGTAPAARFVVKPLGGIELPAEYNVLKVKRNQFNKYGGRGIKLLKKDPKASEAE